MTSPPTQSPKKSGKPQPTVSSTHPRYNEEGWLVGCPVCDVVVEQMKKHALTRHLPFFIRPDLACWKCKRSMHTRNALKVHVADRHCNQDTDEIFFGESKYVEYVALVFGCLDWFCESLNLNGLEELVLFAVEHECFTMPKMGSSPLLRSILSLVEKLHTGQAVDPFFISPSTPGNAFHLLASWEPVLLLLGMVPPQKQQEFKNLHRFAGPQGEYLSPKQLSDLVTVPRGQLYVDGHCHLPELLQRWGMTLTEIEEGHNTWMTGEHELLMIIANLCFPDNWSWRWKVISKVKFTIGIHPKCASGALDWKRVEGFARSPNCVGVGECGLDYTCPAVTMADQRRVFKRQMTLAKSLGKPLVIHGRPANPPQPQPTEPELSSQADLEIPPKSRQALHKVEEHDRVLLEVMEMAQAEEMTEEQKFYIHSYLGSPEAATRFLTVFPQSVFSLGPKCLDPDFPWMSRTVRSLLWDNVVLESDSPIMGSGMTGVRNSPFLTPELARRIANLMHWPTRVVLNSTTSNCKRFFEW
jgi:Tat protein secretion system quality control protein TatD with DNase activity